MAALAVLVSHELLCHAHPLVELPARLSNLPLISGYPSMQTDPLTSPFPFKLPAYALFPKAGQQPLRVELLVQHPETSCFLTNRRMPWKKKVETPTRQTLPGSLCFCHIRVGVGQT